MKLLVAVIGAFVFAGTANAAPPSLVSVGHESRHPTAAFSAPRADDVTIYLASKPDRATDGRFLEENVEAIDFMTDAEIQAGRWLDSSRIEPGTYYVMLLAYPESSCVSYPPPNYQRVVDPSCADGFSNIMTVTIPKPVIRYRVSFSRGFIGSFTIRASHSGEAIPYKLCSRDLAKRRCLRGTIGSLDWDSPNSDTRYLSASDFRKRVYCKWGRRTRMTWFVRGRRVGSVAWRWRNRC
jgi:hypothetical protein